jgi:hypothetical protein
MQENFFQSEKKFVVGVYYETLRVKSRYIPNIPLGKCDEVGTIIPNSEKGLGRYVRSQCYGWGDNGGRYDYFINDKGIEISNSLDYDGTTRYRQMKYIESRIDYLMVLEGIGKKLNEHGFNEHINHYLCDLNIVKEVCSFVNPIIQ